MQGRSKNSFLDSTPDKCLHGGFYGSSAVVLGVLEDDLWIGSHKLGMRSAAESLSTVRRMAFHQSS
jgi:hypothetical protein